jgi:hypothetical protein
MPDTNPSAVEPIDLKEVVRRIDMASGLFAYAAGSFSDIATLFEAIAAAAEKGTLANRLACVGMSICEDRDSDFTEYHEDFGAHFECYSAALPNHPFRRLHSAEDSSLGGA